jgi:outer membrane protein assembly factor BamB
MKGYLRSAGFAIALAVTLGPFVVVQGWSAEVPAAQWAMSGAPYNSWPMQGHDAQVSNFNPDERAIGPATIGRLHPIWSASGVGDAIAVGGQVYALLGSPPTELAALDGRTGRRLRVWTAARLRLTGRRVTPIGDQLQTLAYVDGRIIVGATTEVVAIDPVTGRETWRVSGGAFTLTVSGGVVYTGKGVCENPCGSLATYAIDARSGRVLWRHPQGSDGHPVIVGNRLYQTATYWLICCRPNPTNVYDLASGRRVTRWLLAGTTFWVGGDGATFALGDSGTAACGAWIERVGAGGPARWKACLPTTRPVAPAFAYHTVFGASNAPRNHVVEALDPSSGRVRWRRAWGASSPVTSLAVANHLVFVLLPPSQILVLDAATGRILRRVRVIGVSTVAPSSLRIAGGFLYAGSAGRLVALRP